VAGRAWAAGYGGGVFGGGGEGGGEIGGVRAGGREIADWVRGGGLGRG